jgi:hypothetical protein
MEVFVEFLNLKVILIYHFKVFKKLPFIN